ncbi:MAG: GIY-YIG nuclease family protein [bacterium]
MYYTYILKSKIDGSYYIGSTSCLRERVERHNCKHAGYTAKKAPYKLVHFEKFLTRSQAVSREKKIKSYKGGEAFRKLICWSSEVVKRI